MARGKKSPTKDKMARARNEKEYRVKLWRDFLKHIRAGYSQDCFSDLAFTGISTLMQEFPEDCPAEEFDEATRNAKVMWESIGHRQAEGTCFGNSRSWYYNMSNRYGWSDRQKVESNHSGAISVNVVNYKPT